MDFLSTLPVDLVTVVAFILTSGLVFVFAYRVLKLQQDPVRERLAAAATADTVSQTDSLTDSLAGQLPQFQSDNGPLDQDLRRAGYYKPSARSEYLALRNALVILAVIATGTVAVVIGPDRQEWALRAVAIGLALAALCWAVPRLVLRRRGRRRMDRIRRGLPDALDMITMCLTGGLSMQDSLSHVSRELYSAHPDLAIELLIVREQAEMTTLDIAFRQFALRVDAPEIVAMAALIAQGQRLGTDVVHSIREFADSMRLKRRQANDERSNAATVKVLFPLILCMLPAAVIILYGPAAVKLWNFLRSFDTFGP